MVNCSQCGREFVPIEGQEFCPFCGAAIQEPPAAPESETRVQTPEDKGPGLQAEGFEGGPREDYCPWEDLERLGFLQGILATLQQSLFSPAAFFARLPRHGGFMNPFLYGLIISSLGAMGSYLVSLAINNPFLTFGKAGGQLSAAVALFIPFFVAAGLGIQAVLLHVAVFLTSGARQPFEASFRVVSYATGPDLFNCVPFIGWVITMIWKFYLTVIGVREVHELSTGRSILAVSLPIIVCCGLVTGTVILAVLASGGGAD